MTDVETLRAALWRAVGLTVADIQIKQSPRVAQAATAQLVAVARQVEAMLEPAFLAAAAALHTETTKEAP